MTAPTQDVLLKELLKFDSDEVRIGITGALHIADVKAKAPTTIGKLPATHRPLGYTSQDGVEEGRDEDKSEFTPWQELVAIRTEITKSVVTLKTTLWQSGLTVISVFHKVQPEHIIVNDDGSFYFDEQGKPESVSYQVVLTVIDKGKVYRIVLANAELSERGNLTYKSDEVVGYECTFTAKPGPEGWSVRRIFLGYASLTELAAFGVDVNADGNDLPAPPVSKTVTFGSDPTGGTWTLSFGGKTTVALPYDATAAEVSAALQDLESIGPDNAIASGEPGEYEILLDSSLTGTLTANAAGLTPTTVITVA